MNADMADFSKRNQQLARATLDEGLVIRIREMAAETNEWGRPVWSAARIARDLQAMGVCVSTETVRRVIRRDTWGWLGSPKEAGQEPPPAEAQASLDRLLSELEGIGGSK